MSAVNITNVTVLDNPTAFLSPFQFEISYECLIPLEDGTFLRRQTQTGIFNFMIWNGNSYMLVQQKMKLMTSSLRVCLLVLSMLGIIASFSRQCQRNLNQDIKMADPPDPTKIREEDIIGVTVLLLTCSYLGQEFLRVGYYVNNDYDDEQLREEPPPRVLADRVQRNILADKPRVTKFPISFHPDPSENGGQQQQPPVSPESHTDDDPRSIQNSKC
ncbi:hypothetical protein C4D60_Mb04t25940 [Musa balbisiana]|uniref:Uncharacterized protein n=1 Tax=Musa balbisiana TaxID=52838 RepID=A0A4S8KEU4_MUSBA|nr:hypothetical protein C4D60_Mb04t25940 [Musa balbisiana]